MLIHCKVINVSTTVRASERVESVAPVARQPHWLPARHLKLKLAPPYSSLPSRREDDGQVVAARKRFACRTGHVHESNA